MDTKTEGKWEIMFRGRRKEKRQGEGRRVKYNK